jgi:hypothetical protein
MPEWTPAVRLLPVMDRKLVEILTSGEYDIKIRPFRVSTNGKNDETAPQAI